MPAAPVPSPAVPVRGAAARLRIARTVGLIPGVLRLGPAISETGVVTNGAHIRCPLAGLRTLIVPVPAFHRRSPVSP